MARAGELGLEALGITRPPGRRPPTRRSGRPTTTAEECDALGGLRPRPPAAWLVEVGRRKASSQTGTDAAAGRRLLRRDRVRRVPHPEPGHARGGLQRPAAPRTWGEGLGGSRGTTTWQRQHGPLRRTSEWRTPPPWGLRDSRPYLHDGRARHLDRAPSPPHEGQAGPRPGASPPPLAPGASPRVGVPRIASAAPPASCRLLGIGAAPRPAELRDRTGGEGIGGIASRPGRDGAGIADRTPPATPRTRTAGHGRSSGRRRTRPA